jgi:lysophospholipase
MLRTLRNTALAVSVLGILGSCSAQLQLDPGSYAAKVNQPCPQQLIRSTPVQNQTLNEKEVAYVAARKLRQPRAWKDWVGDGRDIGYDLDALQITSNNGSGLPTIGIAASGGGYR